jgi:hypothetical protein
VTGNPSGDEPKAPGSAQTDDVHTTKSTREEVARLRRKLALHQMLNDQSEQLRQAVISGRLKGQT